MFIMLDKEEVALLHSMSLSHQDGILAHFNCEFALV
jgi:hypothetical protein